MSSSDSGFGHNTCANYGSSGEGSTPREVEYELQLRRSDSFDTPRADPDQNDANPRKNDSQTMIPKHQTWAYGSTLSVGKEASVNPRDVESGEEEIIICRDEAIDIEDSGAGRDRPIAYNKQFPIRLLIVSSKIRNSSSIRQALLPNVTLVQYKYDTYTLDGITGLIAQSLGVKKVSSIAFLLSCVGSCIQLTGKDDVAISKDSLSESDSMKNFFSNMVLKHMDKHSKSHRVDFLACTAVHNNDLNPVVSELQSVAGITVGISKDIGGCEITQQNSDDEGGKSSSYNTLVGNLYFNLEKLRTWSGSYRQQSLSGFEKIRTVGKGAYGAAVLYRKKDDDSLVILKEINMHDLTAAERQMALNEVNVLAMLDHPNIISYYDSFEEDGVLMIEMEYADGGTLSQFLAQQDKPLEEREILVMFQQIIAALRYIHELKILHRDLKTFNIFMTKEGVMKVGDFGISKMMSSVNKGANTVLGTPYYISPEMCEGKAYNEKSDIWALGCILYEMACRQKTFEGSNIPALVNKIMKGQFAPVKGNYSQEFKDLIMDLLKQDPDQRPSANQILYERLPMLCSKFDDSTTDNEDDMMVSVESVSTKLKMRSVLYYFQSSTCSLTPVPLPISSKIRYVAVGADHVAVVTTERQVYTWGDGSKGQLGHGTKESLSMPKMVEALKGKSISRACCGDGFSVFASDNGIILTCGDGSRGCLGHADYYSSYRPRLIESLLSVDVIAVNCGPHHVAVVGSDGEVFTWGHGGNGRLGLGNEDDYCQPMEVTSFPETLIIRDVCCGVDGTMFITDVGSVLACGNNENNKLGLNNRQGFLMAMKNIFTKTEVEGQKSPTLVRALGRHRVINAFLGPNHGSVIVEPGYVYTFGRNTEGQLGIGNTKQKNAPVEVKGIDDKLMNRVQCGELYTVASTVDNELYYWGLRFKPTADDSHSTMSSVNETNNANDMRIESVTPRTSMVGYSHQLSNSSVGSSESSNASQQLSSSALGRRSVNDGVTHSQFDSSSLLASGNVKSHSRQLSSSSAVSFNSMNDVLLTERNKNNGSTDSVKDISDNSLFPSNRSNSESVLSPTQSDSTHTEVVKSGFRPLSSAPKRTTSASSRENLKDNKDKDHDSLNEESEIIFPPTHLVKILQTTQTVLLSNFFCHGENLFIQVETTAGVPRKSRKRRKFRTRLKETTLDVPKSDDKSHSTSGFDGGDEYSSEASELETQTTNIPTWLKDELARTEGKVSDGNEADDTSDDDEFRRGLYDSSMSSIQINKDLSSSLKIDNNITPRNPEDMQDSTIRTCPNNNKDSSQERIQSANSTESGMLSDTSSIASDPNQSTDNLKQASGGNSLENKRPLPNRKISAPASFKPKLSPGSNNKPLTRLRAQGRGRGRGQDVALKEQLAARGFVSDVTVKRREEALANELALLRDEKKKAEDRIKLIEDNYKTQQEKLKKDAAKQIQEKEKCLQGEIERLRTELQFQNSKLKDNENVVANLQDQLSQVQHEQKRIATGRQNPVRSNTSAKPSSKVCSVQ